MPAVIPQEYLDAERLATHKSEYVSGQIWAMSGASIVHNRIAFNLGGLLYTALQGGPCEAFGSDMRVLVAANTTYAYPDLSIVYGPSAFSDNINDTLTNPTAHYDRNVKFIKYQSLPSLREYVLLHQATPQINLFTRCDNIWVDSDFPHLPATLSLETLGNNLPLAQIYEHVAFLAPE